MNRVPSPSVARILLGVLLLGAAGCTSPNGGESVFSEEESYRSHGFNYAEEARGLHSATTADYYDYQRGGYRGQWRNKAYHSHQGTSSRKASSARSSSSLHEDDFTAHTVPDRDEAGRGSRRESSSGGSDAVSSRESHKETPQSKDHDNDDDDDDDNKGLTGGIGGRERN